MAGDYECRATNEMGTASSKCTVKVNSKLIIHKLYIDNIGRLQSNELCNDELGYLEFT